MSLDTLCESILVGAPADAAAAGHVSTEAHVARFSYDAAETTTKRRNPSATIKQEDEVLNPAKRKKLVANASDIQRNFEIAAWAIRKHLDFTTSFTFASNNAENAIAVDADPGRLAEQEERS